MRMTLSRSTLAAAATLAALAPARAANTLSAAEKKQGFVLLFDGTHKSFNDNFVNYI